MCPQTHTYNIKFAHSIGNQEFAFAYLPICNEPNTSHMHHTACATHAFRPPFGHSVYMQTKEEKWSLQSATHIQAIAQLT
jgi:hypothetical protein